MYYVHGLYSTHHTVDLYSRASVVEICWSFIFVCLKKIHPSIWDSSGYVPPAKEYCVFCILVVYSTSCCAGRYAPHRSQRIYIYAQMDPQSATALVAWPRRCMPSWPRWDREMDRQTGGSHNALLLRGIVI